MTVKRPFQPSRRFRRDYNHWFREDPVAANAVLLIFELADEEGLVRFGQTPKAEIQQLMIARFEDPSAHQLPKGAKR
jgi:hypothetical protein